MKVSKLIYLRDLLRELVRRDMKIRYEGTFLGFAWTLVNPLMYVGVFYFLFQVVLVLNVRRFTSFVLIGMLVYTWFQSSLLQGSSIVPASRDLVRRPGFKVSILPVIPVLTQLIHFLLVFPILALVLMFGGSRPTVALLALPIVIGIQFTLTVGLAYLASAVSVLYRDTRPVIEVALRLFFFVSPIFYEASHVPAEFQTIYRLNPLVSLLEAYRNLLIGSVSPNWGSLAIVGVFALLITFAGYQVFTRVSYRFVEEI